MKRMCLFLFSFLIVSCALTFCSFYPSWVKKEIERVVNDKLKDKNYDHKECEKLAKEIASMVKE